ncbi:MAG: hypothetical protein ACI814_005034 [Mariniblastus sp.]
MFHAESQLPTFLLITCKCDSEVQVSSSQVGLKVTCASCAETIDVPSLSSLKGARIDEERTQSHVPVGDTFSQEMMELEFEKRRKWILPPIVLCCLFLVILAGATPWVYFNIQKHPELLQLGIQPIPLLVGAQIIGLVAAISALKLTKGLELQLIPIIHAAVVGDWKFLIAFYLAGAGLGAYCYM